MSAPLVIAVDELTALVSDREDAPVLSAYPIAMSSLLDHDRDFDALTAEIGAELTLIGIEFHDPEDFDHTITVTRDRFDGVDCVYEIGDDNHLGRALEFCIDADLVAA